MYTQRQHGPSHGYSASSREQLHRPDAYWSNDAGDLESSDDDDSYRSAGNDSDTFDGRYGYPPRLPKSDMYTATTRPQSPRRHDRSRHAYARTSSEDDGPYEHDARRFVSSEHYRTPLHQSYEYSDTEDEDDLDYDSDGTVEDHYHGLLQPPTDRPRVGSTSRSSWHPAGGLDATYDSDSGYSSLRPSSSRPHSWDRERRVPSRGSGQPHSRVVRDASRSSGSTARGLYAAHRSSTSGSDSDYGSLHSSSRRSHSRDLDSRALGRDSRQIHSHVDPEDVASFGQAWSNSNRRHRPASSIVALTRPRGRPRERSSLLSFRTGVGSAPEDSRDVQQFRRSTRPLDHRRSHSHAGVFSTYSPMSRRSRLKRFTMQDWQYSTAHNRPQCQAEQILRSLVDGWTAAEANKDVRNCQFPFKAKSKLANIKAGSAQNNYGGEIGDAEDIVSDRPREPLGLGQWSISEPLRKRSRIYRWLKSILASDNDDVATKTRRRAAPPPQKFYVGQRARYRIVNNLKFFMGHVICTDGSEVWWRFNRSLARSQRHKALEVRLLDSHENDVLGLVHFSRTVGQQMSETARSYAKRRSSVPAPPGLRSRNGSCQALVAAVAKQYKRHWANKISLADAIIYSSDRSYDSLYRLQGMEPRPGDLVRLRNLKCNAVVFNEAGEICEAAKFQVGVRKRTGHTGILIGAGDRLANERPDDNHFLKLQPHETKLVVDVNYPRRHQFAPLPRFLQIAEQSVGQPCKIIILDLDTCRGVKWRSPTIQIIRQAAQPYVANDNWLLKGPSYDKFRRSFVITGCP